MSFGPRKRLVLLVGLLTLVAAAWLLLNPKSPFASAGKPSALKRMTGVERGRAFARDHGALQRLRRMLAETAAAARTLPCLHDVPQDHVFSPSEKDRILSLWQMELDAAVTLDGFKTHYRDFWRFPWPPDFNNHAQAFFLAYGAYAAQFAAGAEWIRIAANRKPLETLLDEPSPKHGIPSGCFARLKWNVLHLQEIAQLWTGHAYLALLRRRAEKYGGAWEIWKPVWEGADADFERTAAFLKREGPKQLAANGADIAKTVSFSAWFPIQKEVAEWMGDTRVRRGHSFLVSPEQILELRALLAPGDILIERRNWYLSNVGLPGFWPHAALYLGTPRELDALSADREVQAWLEQARPGCTSLRAFLQAGFPRAFSEYDRPDEHHNPRRALEAMSEGVVFTTLEHTADADYLGVLRARLSPLEKAKAIAEAFRHARKPYDFNFDFRSDSTIVCSELVYKAYQPDAGRKGIHFPLEEMAGHLVLPPNRIVRMFDEVCDSPDCPFDFVCFLDGREKEGRAVFSTLEEFRKSHLRPKWDILQK